MTLTEKEHGLVSLQLSLEALESLDYLVDDVIRTDIIEPEDRRRWFEILALISDSSFFIQKMVDKYFEINDIDFMTYRSLEKEYLLQQKLECQKTKNGYNSSV